MRIDELSSLIVKITFYQINKVLNTSYKKLLKEKRKNLIQSLLLTNTKKKEIVNQDELFFQPINLYNMLKNKTKLRFFCSHIIKEVMAINKAKYNKNGDFISLLNYLILFLIKIEEKLLTYKYLVNKYNIKINEMKIFKKYFE